MTSFQQRYEVYTTSHRLCIDVETALSVKGDATVQNNKLCQKYFSRVFSNGAEQLWCRKSFGEHLFRVLHFVFPRLLLVDTTNKKVYGKFRILVPGFFARYRLIKERVKTKFFKLLKPLILYGTLYSALRVFRAHNLSIDEICYLQKLEIILCD